MPPRLGYRKSRGGCQLCKRRRVKCDEKRPCSACARHGEECIYDLSGRRTSARARPQQAHQERRETHSAESTPSTDIGADQPWDQHHQRRFSHVALTAQGVFAEKTVQPPPAVSNHAKPAADPNHETWSMDLFLMHHYSSSTFATLPRSIEVYDIWQQEIPKLAVNHLFLMHQLLATAAYHLVHLRPAQQKFYMLHALRHQNDAIVNLQAALPNLSADNCHAFFAASTLLTMSGFAASSSDPCSNMNDMSISSLLDTFVLVRGMSEILDSYERVLKQGSLGHLFKLGEQQTCPILQGVVKQLEGLEIPLETPTEEADVCRQTISTTIEWMTRRRSALRVTMSWPICLKDEFFSLLRKRHPIALVILSYYAVLLDLSGSEMWFLKSWGGKILEDISNTIDQRYRPLIKWSLASASQSI